MRKAVLFVFVLIAIFILTSVNFSIGSSVDAQNVFGGLESIRKTIFGQNAAVDNGLAMAASAQPSQSAVADSPEPTQSPTPSPSATPAPTPVPTPTPVPEPAPYTMAWLDKYAPASVASLEEQVGDNDDYTPVTSYPPADTYKLVVDYHNQCVYALTKDDGGNFTILSRVMICTTGGNGHWTPEGTYNMGSKRVRFGYFPEYYCYAQYWSQMMGSFYFHSLLYSAKKSTAYSKNAYNLLGKPGSHGCIRLLVPDARWIYENCAPGTLCIVTTDYPKNEKLKKALRKGYRCWPMRVWSDSAPWFAAT
ncbi:MAG: L,D-transpeptidase, partial [Eubacteriales bacterium]